MHIENQFTVRAPVEEVWHHLLQVEEVVTCVPGAEVIERLSDTEYRGRVKLKVGPLALNFTGDATVEVPDPDERTLSITGSGKDQQGRGAATVAVIARVRDEDGVTRVDIEQDLRVTGKIAQFGRGVMNDVSQRLSLDFAACLERKILSGGEPGDDTTGAPAAGTAGGRSADAPAPSASAMTQEGGAPAPLGPMRLLLWAVGRALLRTGRRLLAHIRSLLRR